jgi:AAA15 family ATPase/GTPase
MLISLTLKNWMSFRDPIKFSMIAGRERHHRERVPKLGSRLRILPVSAIYGANASGKSNFFNAFLFARNFILGSPRKDNFIPASPFKLSQKRNEPVFMAFEFESNGKIYSYSFAVTTKEVQKEQLSRVYLDGSDRILFDLNRGGNNSGKHKNIDFPCAGKDKDLNSRLNFVLQGTLPNQLFINNAYSQRLTRFDDVISWFRSITPIWPMTPFNYLGSGLNEVDFSVITDYIRKLDTGVDEFFLAEKKFTKDDIQRWAEFFKDDDFAKRIGDLEEGEILFFDNHAAVEFNQWSVIKRNGEVFMRKPQTKRHYNETGNSVLDWDISLESEGTLRALNLLPMIHFSAKNEALNGVYIVDELDRSLHPDMAKWIVKNFLKHCSEKTRSQLIFTTHNLLLMDQSLLRRDELWITERGEESNVSRMFSINDFRGVRDDTDIRSNYLMGVFGGKPKISPELVACPRTKEQA